MSISDFTPFLKRLQITSLNPMQEAMLTAYTQPGDLLLLSPTGSGKTLGFLLPLISSLNPTEKGVQALVVSPTRELALQIEQVIRSMGTGLKVNVCYGGHSFTTEANNLSEPPALLVGTPGRLADHLRRGTFSTDSIQQLVLDEFDKSLELGFEEDMAFILSRCKTLRKKILTSATPALQLPAFIPFHALQELNYLQSNHHSSKLTISSISVKRQQESDGLIRLLGYLGNRPTLVFCNLRDTAELVSRFLTENGFVNGIFHGGLEQDERERALIKFRNGSTQVLVTTDLASRGLDIPEIEAVIHYELPLTEESFIHRNGRTARMHASGAAYLFTSETEKLPTYLSPLPALLNIPESWPLPDLPEWETLYIGGGKKNKINKVDIVGLLLQKGGLAQHEVGKIEVLDTASYVAVKRDKIHFALSKIRQEKIKKQKVKMDIAK